MAPGPSSPSATPARRALAIAATVLTGVLGALIVGEYDLHGFTPYVSGVLFGLVAAEVELAIGRDAGRLSAAVVGVCAAGGLGWAAWISSGRGLAPVPWGAWLGVAIAAVVGFGWVRFSGAHTRPARGPAPDGDAKA
jgi:hypothetical protein